MAGIIDTLRERWSFGSMLVRLIFINVGIFVLLRLAALIAVLAGSGPQVVLHWVEMPSNPGMLLAVPWTLFTYMFAQYDFFHLLFNMLWLYWFGEIFLFADSSRRMLALYIYGGLAGALLFMACYAALGRYGLLIGSSASVLAVVVATAVMHPDFRMNLLFLGAIPLKWVAIVTIAIDFLSLGGGNSGGHLAHIGGAAAGLVYAFGLKNGLDITRPFCHLADWLAGLFDRRPSPAVRNRRAKASRSDEDTLDEILDKVKKSGYASLTQAEKRRLFDVSNRIK